jgi:DNA modification methylase
LVAHEDILVFSKGTPFYNPQMSVSTPYNKGLRKQQTENDVYSKFSQVEIKSNGLRYPRSVQYFKTAESEGKTFHKSQKPLALMEYLIRTYTNENDVVMDNCMGSNTTGLACKILNRQFVGIEKDENYFKLSVERVS